MNGPFACGLERKHIEPFSGLLSKHGLELRRGHTGTLQINTGLLCNQACTHCHLEAGPGRKELMGPEIAEEVVGYARRGGFEVVDITGGAPELNPHIVKLLQGLSDFVPRLILRSNLTALNTVAPGSDLPALLKDLCVVITASFPSTEVLEVESKRGVGVLQSSIATLRRLNEMGYGHPASGLELNLIHNPPGPSLPAPQAVLEQRLRAQLMAKWKIEFNNLYTLANSPLGRFRKNLELAGKLDEYYSALAGVSVHKT